MVTLVNSHVSQLLCVVIHCCCPWYCPIFANSCSIQGERISITFALAVKFQEKSMFEGCLSLTELEWFLVAIQISGQDHLPVIKPPPLFGQTTESSLGQAIYSRSGKKQSCLLGRWWWCLSHRMGILSMILALDHGDWFLYQENV